jgi:hypothetical protein
MSVVFSSSQSGAVLRASGAAVLVTAVDRSAGTVTIASTPRCCHQAITFSQQGDRQDSASPTRLKISGLEAWAPELCSRCYDVLWR